MSPVLSSQRKRHTGYVVPTILANFALIVGAAALGGCATESGHVVSRLPATSVAAPGPAPESLPPAQVQQQRYAEIDKRALEASENALALEGAVKLIQPPPTTNIYNGYSRW